MINELEMLKQKNECQLVTFHMDKDLYNEFDSFAKNYGHGAKRKILEMALKDFLKKAK